MMVRRVAALVLIAAIAAAIAGCEALAPPTPLRVVSVTAPPGPVGAVERARVVRVVDGDTILVDIRSRRERVRYIGIDAPESVRPNTPVEPFAREAAAENARLVAGRDVVLEVDVSDRDAFNRLLRYVWLEQPNGDPPLLVNFELVARGVANAVTYPPDLRYTDLFRAAEREARQRGRGLWSSPSAPPLPLPTGE
jgi:micrococcal nuclease